MHRSILPTIALSLLTATTTLAGQADRLVFPAKGEEVKRAVLVAGDEEYRTEESMPMLGKILSQKHGFHCTVLFSWSSDMSYIDPNNQQGAIGFDALADADLMIIGTRFRQPSPAEAKHITEFLDAGKPVIGIRTSTHAFNGKGTFGESIKYGEFGRKILGEQWVSHHGGHKRQGCRGVMETANADHPILNSVGEIFALSDVYGVTHLTDADTILLRAAVTESLDPESKNLEGAKNDPMQPFAWIHPYESPAGTKGTSFCTTGGASVDLLDADLRRLLVNAAYHLTGREVPEKADVDFVDEFNPSFYGFIKDKSHFKELNMQLSDFELGKTTSFPDPKGTPEWKGLKASLK